MSKKSISTNKIATQIGTLSIVLVIVVLLVGLMLLSWRNVRPGYVGIVFDKASHQVTTGAREPGWAFINPFTQDIQEYPVTIQTYSMVQKSSEGSTTGDDSVKIQSNEGQQLNLDVVIQYQVIKEEADKLYQDWGGADIIVVEDRVVRQYTRSQVPVIAAKFGWEEITASKRGTIAEELRTILEKEFKLRHLSIVSFGIREVHLPESLQTALDNKIDAQQRAERQEYELKQARIKATQDKVEAEGQAEAFKARSQGEAESIRIRAQAQAEANRILAESITSELIRYQQVERWDGKLPLFQASDAVPLIDTTSIINGGAAGTTGDDGDK